jgi:hypothetical protein
VLALAKIISASVTTVSGGEIRSSTGHL